MPLAKLFVKLPNKTMKKENALTTPNQPELSLTDLTTRINEREKKIDAACAIAVQTGMTAVQLAIDQGNDLLLARAQVENASRGKFQKSSDNKGWQKWLLTNFPKSDETARKYMALAEKVKTNHGRVLPHDLKSIREAFRVLGLIPEVETETKQLASITVSPVVARLNFIAEWVTKQGDEISTWEDLRRQELKLQLKPVVELFEKL